MPATLSILILDGDGETAGQFEKIPDAQLATASLHSDSWINGLRNHPIDILVVEVSPNVDFTLALNRIGRVRAEYPDLSVFVTSKSQAPELIIAAMRSGAQEFLSKPIVEYELNQSVERIRQRKEASTGNRNPGKLISVFSKTGGVGVTTLAVNLGVALAQGDSKRAALVDLNLQHGDAASLLDLEPRHSIIDACESGDYVDSDKLQSCMTPHPSGLSILAEPPHPVTAEEVSAHQVQSVLQQLRTIYPFVVVDLPHMFEPRVMAALNLSSTVLLTTVATIPALRSAKKVLSFFREMGYTSDKVKLLINRISNFDRIETKEVARTLGYETFWTFPNNYVATTDALNAGMPLVTQKRLTNLAKSIMEMAEAVNRFNTDITHQGTKSHV